MKWAQIQLDGGTYQRLRQRVNRSARWSAVVRDILAEALGTAKKATGGLSETSPLLRLGTTRRGGSRAYPSITMKPWLNSWQRTRSGDLHRHLDPVCLADRGDPSMPERPTGGFR